MPAELIVVLSSRNNYDMLEGEVLEKVDLQGCELINVDDRSTSAEKEKGRQLCTQRGLTYLDNQWSGVQCAIDTVMRFIVKERPNCKWIVVLQHDVYPLSENFFGRIGDVVRSGKVDEMGLMGFNIVDNNYCPGSLDAFRRGEEPLCLVGVAHLGRRGTSKRWLNTPLQYTVEDTDKWRQPFTIEFPIAVAMGINVDMWRQYILADMAYEFHLWAADVAMQFNLKNAPTVILPDLYCMNDQMAKERYGIPMKSVTPGHEQYFGKYGPHLERWQNKWGWHYEHIPVDSPAIAEVYQGTLIQKYYEHDVDGGPYAVHDLGSY